MLQKWYTILPRVVVADNRLTDKQKLLYAEISSLCAKDWICTANNQYFVNTWYSGAKETITRNIKVLEDLGYIFIRLKREGEKVSERQIFLWNPDTVAEERCWRESQGGIDARVKDNIYNNIYSLVKEKKLKPKEITDIVNLLSPYKEEVSEIKLEGANLWIFWRVIAGYIEWNPFFQEKAIIDEAYIQKQVDLIIALWDRFEWLQRDFNWNIPDIRAKIVITELEKLFNWYIDNKKPIKNLSAVLRNWFTKVFAR